MPVFWECDRCAACCRWPGEVKVSAAEVDRLAAHLGIAVDAFIARHTRLRAARDGLSLVEQADGSCEFLADGLCRVQAVKPQQCRDFPNLWRFPGFDRQCRARAVEVTADEWRERVRAATGRVPDGVPDAGVMGPGMGQSG